MTENIETNKESLSSLCDNVRGRFPDAQGELFLTRRWGSTRTYVGHLNSLLDQLIDYCSQFPQGLLRYDPDHPYGIVLTLWCHCTHETGCANGKCHEPADRPRAMLTIKGVEIGTRAGPESQKPASNKARQATDIPAIKERG